MIHHRKVMRRAGASAIEAAFVLPVVFLLVLGLLVGAVGVFRYHEVAHIARETARFASVHGGEYAKQNAAAIKAGTLPSVDETYLANYAKANAFTLDRSQIQVTVSLTQVTPGATAASTTEVVDWDKTTENQNRSPYSTWTDNSTTPASGVEVENTVTVQVTYPWSPGLFSLFGVGTINLTSTSVMPMSH